jgi:DnaJ-class molecular chaperone
MPGRDYYEVLGVARNATPEQIKKAYRAQARKFHPDVTPGDKQAEAKFKEAQQAYDILSEPEKRKLYDRVGHAAFEAGGSTGPRAGASQWVHDQGGPGPEYVDFSQFFGPGAHAHFGGDPDSVDEAVGGGVFDELFSKLRAGRGSGERRGASRRGRVVEAQLTIPFLTAVQGGETTIDLARAGGKTETLTVKVPPGVNSGAKLRLRGRGEPGHGGEPAGDLLIEVQVHPHHYFTREGQDLFVDVPITIGEAVLGARVDVPTLNGVKTLPIPPGTSTGQKLRLRGQGVPAHGKNAAGDLFVVPRIVVPRSCDEESGHWIQEFTERNPQSPRDGLW